MKEDEADENPDELVEYQRDLRTYPGSDWMV